MAKYLPPNDQTEETDTAALFTWTRDGAKRELERIREENEKRTQERRAGREKGQLSQSLCEKLSACNIPQLRKVKKL